MYKMLDNMKKRLYDIAIPTLLSLSMVVGCGGGGGGAPAAETTNPPIEYKLGGRITDTEGNPKSNLNVSVDGKTDITDSNGEYGFVDDIDDGSYTMIIEDNLVNKRVYRRDVPVVVAGKTEENPMMIRIRSAAGKSATYEYAQGKYDFLRMLKQLSGTYQTAKTQRFSDNNIPIQVDLNDTEADAVRPGMDNFGYDSSTRKIVAGSNNEHDFIDFGRWAIDVWNNKLGFTLFEEYQSAGSVGRVSGNPGIIINYPDSPAPNSILTTNGPLNLSTEQYGEVNIANSLLDNVTDVDNLFKISILRGLPRGAGLWYDEDPSDPVTGQTARYIMTINTPPVNLDEPHQDEADVLRILHSLPQGTDMDEFKER